MAASRVILVTGANQGIGFEVVRQLAKQGHIVYLGSRSAEKGKEAVAKLKEENLTNVHELVIDVSNQESVEAAGKHFATQQSHLDVLVNNAGINIDGSTHDASSSDIEKFRTTFETNFFGVINVTNTFVPFLRKSQNPVILNVSTGLASISGQADDTTIWSKFQLPAYNVSKSALNAYTVTLSYAFPEARVNVISPGYVRTSMNGAGEISVEESATGLIKYGILLEKSGPTRSFLDYSGSTWSW